MKKNIFAALFLLAPALCAAAEAPNLLTYQGRLKESGLAVNGNRSVEIFLCSTESGGPACETTQAQSVAVSNGLFRSTFTVPVAVDLTTGNWWLEIKVAGVTLTPRERLTSGAYALYSTTAAFAASVADGSITDAKLATGISASKLTGALPAISGAALTDLPGGVSPTGGTMTGQLTNTSTVTVTGSDGQYGLVVSSGVSLAGLAYTSNGGLGLGTASPQARLDVLSAGTAPNVYAQIWRNGSGTEVASMTSQGVLYATLPPGSGDGLGTHNAVNNLQMNWNSIYTVSTVAARGDITAARYQVDGSTVLAVLPGLKSLAVGVDAGRLSQANENTFVGYYSGSNNTSGGSNSFFGALAGEVNGTGGNNSFFGAYSGHDNSGGVRNNFFGVSAGYGNNAGNDNAFFGAEAGRNNTGGSGNVGIGGEAAKGAAPNSFSDVVAIGYQAGLALTTGSGNIFVGKGAGASVGSGNNNIVIGASQDVSVPSANSQLNIGGVLFGDLSARTIGISTRAPAAALDLVSTGTAVNIYAQIWRNGSGTEVASMTSQGVLYATLPPGSGDGLGTHSATADLAMNAFNINSAAQLTVSTITGPGSAYVYVNRNLALPASLLAIGNGISSSGYPLAVYGNSGAIAPVLHLENKTNGPGSGIGVRFSAAGSGWGALSVVDESATGAGTSMRFETFSGEVMRLHGARMGVGAAAPDQKLTVNGNISQTGVIISSGTGDNYFAGRVGIGTPAPAYALDVNYAIRAYAPSGANGMIILGDGDIAHGVTGVAPTTDTFGLITAESPTGGMHLQGFSSAPGTVGAFLGGVIGSADPVDSVAAVQLEGGKKNGVAAQAMGALETVFGVRNYGGSNLLTMLGNGNVGVGTTGPGYKLDVQGGSINASASICINGDCKSAWSSVGDGLGSHIATTDLNLAQYSLVSVASVTMVGKGLQIGTGLTAAASGIFISTGGAIQTVGAGHGAVAGDPRGMGAVDLQTARDSALKVAAGNYSVIGGGRNNMTSAKAVSVAGGMDNRASADYAAVGGGLQNVAYGTHSVLGGGTLNVTIGEDSVLSGGYQNTVAGYAASITGGAYNTAKGYAAAVLGGANASSAGDYAAVIAGNGNTANGDYSFAGGKQSSSTVTGAFTWSDSKNAFGSVFTQNTVPERAWFKMSGGFLVTGSTNTNMQGALNRGVFITGDGLLGVSTGTPGAALDVVSTGTAVTDYAQIWRNSLGTSVATMTATGMMQTAKLEVGGDVFRVAASSTIASSSDPCNAGEIRWDASFVYVCVAANTWRRATLGTW